MQYEEEDIYDDEPQYPELDRENLKMLREKWLHVAYEYPKGTRHHIFWIGISPKTGRTTIGISSGPNDKRSFHDIGKFLAATRDKPDKFIWHGKVGSIKWKARNYDQGGADLKSIRDALDGSDGYLGDGIYLSGPNKNYP